MPAAAAEKLADQGPLFTSSSDDDESSSDEEGAGKPHAPLQHVPVVSPGAAAKRKEKPGKRPSETNIDQDRPTKRPQTYISAVLNTLERAFGLDRNNVDHKSNFDSFGVDVEVNEVDGIFAASVSDQSLLQNSLAMASAQSMMLQVSRAQLTSTLQTLASPNASSSSAQAGDRVAIGTEPSCSSSPAAVVGGILEVPKGIITKVRSLAFAFDIFSCDLNAFIQSRLCVFRCA